jgi:hypothetical protein
MESPLADIDIQGLKHFKRLLPLLRRLDEVGCDRDKAGNRQLLMSDYCAAVILYLFSPMLNSLRMLRQAMQLPQVKKVLGLKRFSLGSFSESVRVFEPRRLQAIVEELAGELVPLGKDSRLAELKHALTLVDGTVLRGLSRLASAACAQTRYNTARDGRAVHGWRLHMQLDLETFCPHQVTVTGARNSGENRETHVLRRSLEADRCYVGDGGYGDHGVCNQIVAHASSYVFRIREDSVLEVLEEKLLSQEALDAQVVRDAIVRLGGPQVPAMNHATRLIVVQVDPQPRQTRKTKAGVSKGTRPSERIVLVSNLVDLPAELVALIYRYRYSVELFFRFFKQLLGMRHLLSQRQEGVEIQVYCCVIACMLINLQTGKKPNKLMVGMISWYLLGVAREQDVINFLNQPDNRGVKLRAKEALWKRLGF